MGESPDAPNARSGRASGAPGGRRRRASNAATGVVDAFITSAGGERLGARHVKPQPPEEPVVAGFPLGLLRRYADTAALHSVVREVEPDVWVARVVGLEGAWSDGGTPNEARRRLPGVIVEWVVAKLTVGARDIPPIEDIDLNRP